MPARFIFAACQAGSEAALKHEVARTHPQLRFAYSRPGFLTFRLPDAARNAAELGPDTVFARTSGGSLGKASGDDPEALARDAWRAFSTAPEARRATHLHVWPRDRATPGDFGFTPGATAETTALGAAILRHRPPGAAPDALRVNEAADAGDVVLDCIVVEPNEWWLGWHRATRVETRWPGGVPNMVAPPDMISRAYLKIAEALLWSGLPIRAGDRCVEIGSAPGGSCQALLERGCHVTGIDPAAMDARVLAHPRFTHVRARVRDLDRAPFAGFRWLVSDANVAPNYTLDTVEAIVTAPRVRLEGLLLTLKLTDSNQVRALPALAARIRAWGYSTVRLRQLAFNRREICAFATGRPGTPPG